MRVLHFLFPFAFKKNHLADYTALLFFIAISLVISMGLGILFLELGSFWQYVSIPFWGLFLYDLLAMTLATLFFFDLVKVKSKPKKVKASQVSENHTPAVAPKETSEENT